MKGLLDCFLDVVAAHPPGNDLTVGADQDKRGDGPDAEFARGRALNSGAQESLSPRELSLFLEGLGLVDFLIDAQAQDREVLILAERLVDSLELRNLGDARSAPRRPEVE